MSDAPRPPIRWMFQSLAGNYKVKPDIAMLLVATLYDEATRDLGEDATPDQVAAIIAERKGLPYTEHLEKFVKYNRAKHPGFMLTLRISYGDTGCGCDSCIDGQTLLQG